MTTNAVLVGVFLATAAVAQDFDTPFYNANVARIRELAQQAPFVIVGAVTNIGPAPGGWSGRYRATQSVTYAVQLALKGNLTQEKILVNHLVVRGSSTARPGNSPGLSPRLFRLGTKLILFVTPAASGAPATFDEVGTIPASARNLTAVHEILGIP
jgi:hypothetical protein